MSEARIPVARFLGAQPSEVAFVSNATAGVQAVVRSQELSPGDTVVTTTHRYDAVHRILQHACDRSGAHLIEAHPGRQPTASSLNAAVHQACTPTTRLVVLDSVTSPTAEVLPIATTLATLRENGIRTLVDGAHAPGLIDVDLGALGADYWVGNLHKWICAPRGTAVLYVDPAHHETIRAPITSHGHGLGFHAEFDWTGTFDPTGWLSAPAAIAQHEAWGGAALRHAHRALATQYRSRLLAALKQDWTPSPVVLHPIAMVAVSLGVPSTHWRAGQQWLAAQHIEAPLVAWRDETILRVSAFAAYNTLEDIQRLVDALPGLRTVLTHGKLP